MKPFFKSSTIQSNKLECLTLGRSFHFSLATNDGAKQRQMMELSRDRFEI
jgi:hypothetical protein